jgi:purine-binding chemotaxis protein CheW
MQCDITSDSEGALGPSLLCRAEARWCALPLRHVVETMRPLPLSPIPGAPPFVAGLAIIRGAAVPVVDLARLLGAVDTEPKRFVSMTTQNGHIALAVDQVEGVRSLPSELLHSLPPLLQCADSRVVHAVGTLDDELLLFLQIARVVPEDLWGVESHRARV